MTHDRFLKFDQAQVAEDVIRRSHRLKLDLWHFAAEEDEPAHIKCEYEVHGSLELQESGDEDAAAFVRNLFHAFRKTERIDTEGGAQC